VSRCGGTTTGVFLWRQIQLKSMSAKRTINRAATSYDFRMRQNRNKTQSENRNFLLTPHFLRRRPIPTLPIYPVCLDGRESQTKTPVAVSNSQVQQKKILHQKSFSSRDYKKGIERDIFRY